MPKPEPPLTPQEKEYLDAVVADIRRLIGLNLMGEITDEELNARLRARWEKGAAKRRRGKKRKGKEDM